MKKAKKGQPASFTDIFAYLLGEHLLGEKVCYQTVSN